MAISYSSDAIATAVASLTISVTGKTGSAANLKIYHLGNTPDTIEENDCPCLSPAIEAFVSGSTDDLNGVGGAGTAVYESNYSIKWWYHHCPIAAIRSGSELSVERQRLYTNMNVILAALLAVDTTIINTKEIQMITSTTEEPGEIGALGHPQGWGGNTYGCPLILSVREFQNL